jgi:hypothetical protein
MRRKETRMEKRNNELINKEYLLVMAVCHAGENVGRQGTVEEQMCHAAYLCEKVRLKQYRYIRAASATTIAGVLESDQTERLLRNATFALRDAVKKILFLNSICRSLTGQSFLNIRVDRTEFDICDQLAEEFSQITHYVREYLTDEIRD